MEEDTLLYFESGKGDKNTGFESEKAKFVQMATSKKVARAFMRGFSFYLVKNCFRA
jgi:hypothetical protein